MSHLRGRKMESNMSWIKNIVNAVVSVGVLSVLPALAQPNQPTTEEYLCSPTPTNEEVASTEMDKDGWVSLFDGVSWKGLWQNCQSSHSSDKAKGAIWKIDPVEKAIFSTQRGSSGGLLLTKKKYGNYEVQFDMWPSFGNDGGFFNRVTVNGVCYQTVMDYIQGASMLGTWPEGGYQGSYDFRPSAYTSGSDPKLLSTTGNINDNDAGKGGGGGWTKWTAKVKPAYLDLASAADLGCAATGCVAADWNRLWSFDGWNQIRIKFYGGTAAGTGKIHMQSWFRKAGATMWVPVWTDSITKVDPPSYIGLQVHGGGRFGGAKGNWYKNYKVRELNNNGEPTGVATFRKAETTKAKAGFAYDLRATLGHLVGNVDVDHTITVRDLHGKVLETFSGRAGSVNYRFKSENLGLLLIDVKTAAGTAHQQLTRI
jgi:hypothetical protein